MVKGKRPKIFYATQAAVAPPTFVFFAREAGSVHFSYQRYLENRLRETFGFLGAPLRLVFRERAGIRIERKAPRKGRRAASDEKAARGRPVTATGKPTAKAPGKAPGKPAGPKR